ncbi:hypothetical protein ACFXJ8_15390 [Nonomuraea sp. NPDC059194]|uniref:hypothetical protein n=1 Tax=Nonomuraea sp. NPDC059194 TaxID=3346764 RepID=UPI00367A39A3
MSQDEAATLLRRAVDSLRTHADPSKNVSDAALALTEAAAFLTRVMSIEHDLDDDSRRKALSEAQQYVRPADLRMRFARLQADEEMRSRNRKQVVSGGEPV